MKKIIGCTPRLLTEDTTEKQFVNTSYVEALLPYDVNVIMLTLNNPNLDEVLDLCDGLLITGGSDLDPKYFNEENEGKSRNIKPALDIIDKKVVEYGIKHKTPILGICRGHQSLNVFLGGSLYQDIGTNHSDVSFGQEVNTYKNDYLAFDEKVIVNSYHHQAVKNLAPNMEIIARHSDGTVEAIVHKTLPIIGIQWHPERLTETKTSKIIFDKFIEYVKAYKK